MARILKSSEFPAKEAGAAMQSAVATKPTADHKEMEKETKWLPYEGSDKLPTATVVEKVRARVLSDGTQIRETKLIYKCPGAARYFISPAGELIAVYRARGGIHRKLVYQFKRQYKDDALGKLKKEKDRQFRDFLKARKIPGA